MEKSKYKLKIPHPGDTKSLYEAVSEWVTGRILCEDKTHITGLAISDPDILVPKEPSLVFQAGTAKYFSWTDSDETNNLIYTPELKTSFYLLGTILSSNIFFFFTFNWYIFSAVKAYDLFPKLRARPEYQLSSGTKPVIKR